MPILNTEAREMLCLGFEELGQLFVFVFFTGPWVSEKFLIFWWRADAGVGVGGNLLVIRIRTFHGTLGLRFGSLVFVGPRI